MEVAPGPATLAVGYRGWVNEVKRLRRAGRDEDAERLLLDLVEATEAEAAAEGFGVAPCYEAARDRLSQAR